MKKQKTDIKYVKGSAISPVGEGTKIIVHICNDIGKWGKGFVLAISGKWKEPEAEYKKWYASGKYFELGGCQVVNVEHDIEVANIIGQHGIKTKGQVVPPIRYDAVRKALADLREIAEDLNASLHMPRIGCGLAGGTWDKMEPIIQQELADHGLFVTVYDFGPTPSR